MNQSGAGENFERFSNQEFVDYGLREGLIQPGQGAKDLVEILEARHDYRGDLLRVLVEANDRRRKGNGKAPVLTGEVGGKFYDDPRAYIRAVREKLRALTRNTNARNFDPDAFVDGQIDDGLEGGAVWVTRHPLPSTSTELSIDDGVVVDPESDGPELLPISLHPLERFFVKATDTVDRTPLDHVYGKGQKVERVTDPEKIGKWNENNGFVAFIDGNGIYWVGKVQEGVVQALEKAGYKNAPIPVPHSNDGGAWMADNFDALQARLDAAEKQEQIEESAALRVEKLRSLAHLLDKNLFRDWTGRFAGHSFQEIAVAEGTLSEIGYYAVNSNVLAFVDENRRRWVAPYSMELVGHLHAAGYEPGICFVPQLAAGGENTGAAEFRREFGLDEAA